MKKKFTNKLIACVLAFATAFGAASTSVGAAIIKIEKSLYNTIEQNFTPLDLRQVANRGFADDVADDGVGGWGDGGPNNDLRSFTLYGNQNFCGVDFDIINPAKNDDKSCIVLSGQNDKRLPVSVELDVNQKAGGAYFLHAASWASTSNGKYIFVYADGTEAEVENIGAAMAQGDDEFTAKINEIIQELVANGQIDEWFVKHSEEASKL
jgi:hypothetical protein